MLSRGIAGIDERARGLAQRWFDMVDWKHTHWRSANVGSAQSGVSRSIEGHTKKLESEVHRQHPARVWVERQERKSQAKEPERTTTTHECTSHLLQLVGGFRQEVTRATTEIDWRAADPAGTDRLPPGWGPVWIDKWCSELEGTPAQHLRALVNFLREMEIRCEQCQVRHVGTCRKCHIGWCTQCQQAEEKCEV